MCRGFAERIVLGLEMLVLGCRCGGCRWVEVWRSWLFHVMNRHSHSQEDGERQSGPDGKDG